MKSNSNLLRVVMDGIKDAGLLYDYADQAELEGNKELHDWFMKKAEERTTRTEQEWKDAKSVMHLEEKQDDMSMCLKQHVQREMADLKGRAK